MLSVRTFVCIALSVILMLIGQSKIPAFQTIHASMNLIVLPIQYVVNTPIKLSHWLANSITTEQRLLDENARLRAHQFLLQARLQRLLALEKENGELRGLLQSSAHLGGKALVAQLLAIDLSPSLQQMVVNKGMFNKVYLGQPVLDAYGVMGQIVSVGPLTSKILLLTDSHSAIPVQSYRNGVRSVAIGQGNQNNLALLNVPETTDIRKGDLFVTSGLGQRYPVGYPVGVVIDKKHVPGEHFNLIVLRPKAHLDRTQQLLLAWPKERLFNETTKRS